MAASELLEVCIKALFLHPLKHRTNTLEEKQHKPSNNSESKGYALAGLLLKDPGDLIKSQLIASKGNSLTFVAFRSHECLSGKVPYVRNSDELKRLVLEGDLPTRQKHLSLEPWFVVIHESSWSKKSPIHIRQWSLFNQIMLYVIFTGKVRNWRAIVERPITTAVDRAVHKEPQFVIDTFVDECCCLFDLLLRCLVAGKRILGTWSDDESYTGDCD